MRNISFMLTTEQVKNETKIVTRRNGWKFLKEGELLQGVEKCQGLKKGEKIKKLKVIKVTSVSREQLSRINQEEVNNEGFPDKTPEWFIEMFCKSHKGVTPDSIITRIKFKYIKTIANDKI